MKNAIERLSQELSDRLPGLRAFLDPPEDSRGTWWLDLEYSGRSAVVEWRPRRGFGVSAPAQGEYGEGSDESHATFEGTRDRVMTLLRDGGVTKPPGQVVLRKL